MVLNIIENNFTSRTKLLNLNVKLEGFMASTTNLIVSRKKEFTVAGRMGCCFVHFIVDSLHCIEIER